MRGTFLKMRPILVTVTLLVLLAGMLSLSGCSGTWRGAGKDVEDVGEAMQN